MRPLLSPEEMSRADAAAIAAGTPDEVLMDRAGRAAAWIALRLLGGRYGKRVAVVSGKGNNGGDGFVVGRVLHREGVAVRCAILAPADDFKGAAARHLALARAAGVTVEDFDPRILKDADLLIDAVFGTGFRGSAEGLVASAIEAINEAPAPVLAIDIPSGVDGTAGRVEGPAVRAEVTVAVAAEKLGTALPPGCLHAGRVEVVDIGIDTTGARAWVPQPRDVSAALPARPVDSHKRDSGSVAILAGGRGMSGAALLCARGAGRMGAGYVTLGCTSRVEAAKASVLPEVLSEVVSDDDFLGEDALKRFSEVIERADAVAVGPGLGQGSSQRLLVEGLLAEVDIPIVLDADALNVLAEDPSPLERRTGAAVITPHPGEMARMLDTTVAEVQSNRLDAARRAADRFGCVVLLKGYRTIVADPSGNAVVNPTGGPELATAGTGDVLTGVLVALLGRRGGANPSSPGEPRRQGASLVPPGPPPFEAAWVAAYVHGTAGALAAQAAGSAIAGREQGVGASVLAWDVAEALPEAAQLVSSGANLTGR